MKFKRKIIIGIIIVLIAGFLLPQNFRMPVKGAAKNSYNKETFWYYPWGKSGVHKGVDIFAKKGTPVVSSTPGIVLYCGQISRGGNVAIILGPKWRIHYYAHLDSIKTSALSFVNSDNIIGTVGTTGNAQGKPPHLHYSISTVFPYVWRIDRSHQGWKKMFYLNPVDFIEMSGI